MKNPPSLRINVLYNKEELYSLNLVCRKLLHVQYQIPSTQQELKLLKFWDTKTYYIICKWWDHTNITLFNLRNRLLYAVLPHLPDPLPSALTLTGRPFYIEMLVPHIRVKLSWPSLWCAAHKPWPLCPCVLHMPFAAGSAQPTNFNRGACRQHPVGTSSYTTCASFVQQCSKFPWEHPCHLTEELLNSCFLVRKSHTNSNNQNVQPLLQTGSTQCAECGSEAHWMLHNLGFQCLKAS